MTKLYPIAVDADVKQAIGSLGHAGMSYNKVLRRLLNLEEKKSQAGPSAKTSQLATAPPGLTGDSQT